jgi:two-component sensor histidine kinase
MNDPVNILLVDDDVRNLDVLESILASPDYRLTRARTADEALLALIADEYAVIVLDVRMPDVSGLELAHMIKRRKKTRHVPIIFLTAYYQEDKDVLQGYGAGAVDYLSKPVNPLILLSKVGVFVELFRKTRALATMNVAMEQEIAAQLEQLKASLAEKDTLLKEIHHRVKNNLQIISSLISLQADKIADAGQQRLLQDTRDRVKSMALVHEKLYQSKDLGRVDMAEYARQLLHDLIQVHGPAAAKIRLCLDLEPVLLPVDVAIPCGLMVNELTTNAIKHAFHDRPAGAIDVRLAAASDGTVDLFFADNGRGFPPQLDWRSADTLGLQLVRMLAEQIQGTVEMLPGGGAAFRINFGRSSRGRPVHSPTQDVMPTEERTADAGGAPPSSGVRGEIYAERQGFYRRG